MDILQNSLDFIQCNNPEKQVQALAVLNKQRGGIFYQIVDSLNTHNTTILQPIFDKQSKGLIKDFKIEKQDNFSCISDKEIIEHLLSSYDEISVKVSNESGDVVFGNTIYTNSVAEHMILDYTISCLHEIVDHIYRIGSDEIFTFTFRLNGLYIMCFEYDVALSKCFSIDPITIKLQNMVSKLCSNILSLKFNFSKKYKTNHL